MSHVERTLWRTLMRLAVRVYPASWRRRYEVEMFALLDESQPPRASQFIDLLRSGAREWLAELGRLIFGQSWRQLTGHGAGFLADASGIVLQAVFMLTLLWLGSRLFPWVRAELSWFGDGPWTPWGVAQIAGLTLRAMILARLPLAVIDYMYRRAGRKPVDGRWRNGTLGMAMLVGIAADSALAHQFQVGPPFSQLRTQFGFLPLFIWIMAWGHASRRDRGRDAWRVARDVLTAPYRLYRQGSAA
jgi:hypothetical protein